MKRILTFALCALLLLSLCACTGTGSPVAVQRADQLAAAGRAGERYAGMVVNEAVVEITRDGSKKIAELCVEVGQTVAAGDRLFSYDLDEVELALEKTQLEVEKMTNEQATYTEQLEKLEKQLARTYNEAAKTRLTLEINTLKTTMLENEYNLKAKDKEIAGLQEMLQNIDILSPVDGTVRKVDEQGQSGSYITIQQAGAYRIQGAMNEMSLANGMMVGTRVKVCSRVSDQTWMGTVISIETEDSSQNNNDYYYGGGIMDSMTTSSNYVFYVELDSVEGLLLGQHVYMEIFVEQPAMEGLWIPESFLTEMTMNEETFEMTASVWVANDLDQLELRGVTLGMYDYMTGCYEILSGLSPEDYVADPANPNCAAGAAVSRREPTDFSGGNVSETAGDDTAAPDEMLPSDDDAVILPEEEVLSEEEVLPEQEALPEELPQQTEDGVPDTSTEETEG